MNTFKISHLSRRLFYAVISSPALIFIFICTTTTAINILYFSNGLFLKVHKYYLGGAFIFSASYLLFNILFVSMGKSSVMGRTEPRHKKPSGTLTKINTAIGATGAAIALYIILTRGGSDLTSVFVNLRYSHTGENMPQYGSAHLALFSLSASVMWLARGSGKMAAFCLLLYTLPSIAVAERTSVLFGFITFFYVGIATRKISISAVTKTVVLILIFFIALAFATNKDQINDTFFLIPYISYGITAFDLSIIDNGGTGCLSTVLGSYSKPFEMVGAISPCDATIYADPGAFNVYTYMMNPYIWNGWPGIVIAMTIIGFVYALARISQHKSLYHLMIYASLLYPIVMVFYAWVFSLTTIIYWSILCITIATATKVRIK